MSIKKFFEQYSDYKTQSIKKITTYWKQQKAAEGLLATSVAPGVIVYDVLKNGYDTGDSLSPEIKEAFSGLMGGKADSYTEIRNRIVEKYSNGKILLR